MLTRDDIAKMAKVDQERVQRIQVDLQRLRENGALVRVHCYGVAAIDRKATRHERGVADNDLRAKGISPGRIKTVPEEYAGKLVALREASRALVDKLSFGVTGFKPWRYIPVDAFGPWLKQQEEYEERFEAVKEECCAAMDDFVEAEMARFAELAAKSWNAIWANAAKRGDVWEVEVDGYTYVRSDESFEFFRQRIVDHAISCIPSQQRIMTTMKLSWSVGGIETASSVMRELAEYDEAKSRSANARHAASVADLEAFKAGQQLRKEEAAEDAELRAMRAVVAERIATQLTRLPDPGIEMIDQLRQSTGETTQKVLGSLKAQGRLYKGSSVAIGGMVERFDLLNPGDDDLEALIDELKGRMIAGPGAYDYDQIQETLEKIEVVCSHKADETLAKSEALIEVMALPGVVVKGKEEE